MIMHIFSIALEKLVYKDVERKSFAISKKHIVAFQVWLIVHPVHNNTVPTPTFKEFFKHMSIIQDQEFSVKKKPYRRQGFVQVSSLNWTACLNLDQA